MAPGAHHEFYARRRSSILSCPNSYHGSFDRPYRARNDRLRSARDSDGINLFDPASLFYLFHFIFAQFIRASLTSWVQQRVHI